MRLAHVITGLGGGGAEFMLARLCAALPRDEFELQVISLTGGGPVAAQLRALSVPVIELGMHGAMLNGLLALRRELRAWAPDVVQTWLCHADLIGGLVTRVALGVPVIWGVHQAEYDPATTPWSTRAVLRACAVLAQHVPARVVSCSEAGKRARIAAGFPSAIFDVIPNGVDISLFRPDAQAGARLRAELGVDPDTLLIGMPARWHVDKDHALLCATATRVLQVCPSVRFVLCGDGIEAHNTALAALVSSTGRADAFHLLGFRVDMPALLAALDVGVLSSRTEAFPNVVAETMACGVPCVATAVGDVAAIIGDAGRVVPARDAQALAAALIEVLRMPNAQRVVLATQARTRVVERFSLSAVAARYADVYRATMAARAA